MAKKGIDWKKIKYERLIPMVVLALLVLYLIISLVFGLFSGGKKNKDPNIYKIGDFTGKKTLEIINAENRENPKAIMDYNFYGESLNLYFDSYDRNRVKSEGRTYNLVLTDLCSENRVDITVGPAVDNGLYVRNLKPGFYSVYLQNGETYERLYMNNTLYNDNIIYSLSKDGKRLKLEMLANHRLFDEPEATESVLDQNYLYLKVTEEALPEEVTEYDVALVTAPALLQLNVSLDGEHANGLVEGSELWDVAENVKTALEEAGLRVKVLKDSFDERVLYYGSGNVANRAYNSRAKYVLFLDMQTANSEVRLLHSMYSSDKLARSIYEKLAAVGIYDAEGSQLKASTKATSKEDGLDYDSEWEIRELGGQVLGAGAYSATSREENESFAARNIYGINTLKLTLLNIRDKKAAEDWLNNKDAIGQAIAEGFLAAVR